MSRPDSFALDVRVPQSDISASRRKNRRKCALALAISRSVRERGLGLRGRVYVLRDQVRIGRPNPRVGGGVQIDWQASLTRAARDFVIDFDAGRQVQPLSCRLVFRRFL